MTTTIVDSGRLGAKFSNRDNLLELMRGFVREGLSREIAISKAYSVVMQDEILTSDAVRYCLTNVYERCIFREKINTSHVKKTVVEYAAAVNAKTKEIVEADIKLWHWKIPTLGKNLPECTFGELPDTAPIIGRFLTKLSQQGAPGTLVKEVFTDEEQLQAFWRSCQ